MQKTIPTIFLVFAVLFATAETSWGQEIDHDNLLEREGLMYRPFTTVPFTGQTTGLRQATYKNGIRHGPWVEYHENGQLHYKGNYINGERDGAWVWYVDNGLLLLKGNYIDGKKEGPWVGFLAEENETYKDGVRISD